MYEHLIGTVWKFSSSWEHLQLCRWDYNGRRFIHEKLIVEGVFVLAAFQPSPIFSDEHEEQRYALVTTDTGELKGCWFNPKSKSWIAL